jgi:hypothetical protein
MVWPFFRKPGKVVLMNAGKVRAPPVAVVIMLLIALATTGVAYGLWSKTLTIEGTVNTGEVDARWEVMGTGCFEFYPWPQGGNFGEVLGKDVGDWDIWVDAEDNQVLHFEIYNGYPSYAVDCELHFRVMGTIPVFVRGTRIVPGQNLTNCILSGVNEKTLACDQLTVILIDNLGTQLHPGDGAASSLIVHVEQPADENTIYEFDVGICMAQWNEYATEGECFAAP